MKIKNSYLFGFILFFIILIISCSSNKKTISQQSENIQNEIIQEAIKEYFNIADSLYIISNEEQSKILYLSENPETTVNPVNNISFFVFDKRTKKIICQNKFSSATLKWLNNNQLILTRVYGIMNEIDGNNIKKFTIDLNTKEITEIRKENNQIFK